MDAISTVLVTGGCGFIGSNYVRLLLREEPGVRVVNFDALTYAGNPANLADCEKNPRYCLVVGDITDRAAVEAVFEKELPTEVVHFAAESHVDRSILDSSPFVRTNVLGTQVLLDVSRMRSVKRFVQVSTDEVYGSLGNTGFFTEETPLAPNSPYAASKAAADLLVRAYVHTHGFPAMITCRGIHAVLKRGKVGGVYNLGGLCEKTNIELTQALLGLLGKPATLIRHVADRPGHDRRYAIDCSHAEKELGWRPTTHFEDGLQSTVAWYLEHSAWVEQIRSGAYRQYYEAQYGHRGV